MTIVRLLKSFLEAHDVARKSSDEVSSYDNYEERSPILDANPNFYDHSYPGTS